MTDPLFISPSPAGSLLAVACVVAGGPWFADGLRALRVRRALGALPASAGKAITPGPLHVRGRVVLESPMFSPLSGRPCACYQLDVRDERGAFVGRVSEEREFRVELETGVAQVAAGAELHLGVSDERTFGSPGELSEHLAELLERTPELRWLKARGGALIVIERALFAGADAHVLGRGERGAVQWHERTELVRTGTDDAPWEQVMSEPVSEWHITACTDLDRAIVSDHALEPRRLAPPMWRSSGALMGPALSLAGLLELAEAAGRGLDGGL